MNVVEMPLGPKGLGAEILTRIARRKLTGVLRWNRLNQALVIEFEQGRPLDATSLDNQRSNDTSHLSRVVRSFATASVGRCTFELAAPKGKASTVDTLGEAMVALIHVLTAVQLDAFWSARSTWPVEVNTTFSKLNEAVALMTGLRLQAPPAGKTAEDLIKGADEPTRRAWTTLVALGGVFLHNPAHKGLGGASTPLLQHFSGLEVVLPQGVKAAEATAAASPPSAKTSKPAPKESDDVATMVREIEAAHAKMQKQNHYEFLGVAKDAGADVIRKAYFKQAKLWHADRFSGKDLGNATRSMQDLFVRAEEANRTLSNPDDRKTYDWVLERQAQGLPTDPAVIMQAENLFIKGQQLLRRGNAIKAEPLLRQAVELNKGEAEFWAYFGYSVYCTKGREGHSEAVAAINRALQLRDSLDSAYEFLGKMARVEGDIAAAERYLMKALELNADNADAQRELRLITMRTEQQNEKPKSIFGRKKS